METTKKVLNISLAASFILSSVSLFIFSLKSAPANAQPGRPVQGDYVVAGVISSGINSYEVLGYNTVQGAVKVLGKYKQ